MYNAVVADSLSSILELLALSPRETGANATYAEDWSVEPEVRILIEEVARNLSPTSYLEIGAYRGDTFFAVLGALKTHCRAYAIEPDPCLSQIIRAKKTDYVNGPNAILIEKTSRQAFNDWGREQIDLIFVDGDHSFPETVFDISAWSTVLSPDGVMIVHDTLTRLERRFPQDYIANPWDFDILDIIGLQQRCSKHAWEGVAFLKWTPSSKEKVVHRHAYGKQK
jgi:predicted O-methyltransferase YrrM